MGFVETLLLAASLGLDTFAAGLSLGLITGDNRSGPGERLRPALRFAGLLAALHVLLPVLGWLAATPLRGFVERWAPWLALALLVYAGGHMIHEGLAAADEHTDLAGQLGDWRSLILLCLALSVDVIAVGVGLGLAGQPIWLLAGLALATTLALSLAGALLGGVISGVLGRRAPVVGGLILLYIGVRILLASLA